jgi:hypothetical protein
VSWAVLCAAIFTIAAAVNPALAEKRVALIVGNSA